MSVSTKLSCAGLTRARALARRALGACAAVGLAFVALVASTAGLQTVQANGDTRTLSLYHTHTDESLTVTFKRNGSYDREALRRLNWFLRDWRRDEPTEMDPRLFDLLWEVYREVGAREPINVVSAYRAPATNNMLRSRSRGVARYSQHTQGRAIDFYLTDVSMARVRELGMRKQRGGVGFYPSSANAFVHLDVGNVRSWPRMTRDQLARLFPDGNTIHIPADGRPMPGFEATIARIGRDGKGGDSGISIAEQSQPGFNWFARLFGGGQDAEEGDDEAYQRLSPRQRRAQVAQRAAQQREQAQAREQQASTAQMDNPLAAFFGQRPQASAQTAAAQVAAVQPGATAQPAAPAPQAATPPPLPPEITRPAAVPQQVAALPVPLPPERPAGAAVAAIIPLPPERPRADVRLAALPEPTATARPTAPEAARTPAQVALNADPIPLRLPETRAALSAPAPLPPAQVAAAVIVTGSIADRGGPRRPQLAAPWSYGPLLAAPDGGVGRRMGAIERTAVDQLVREQSMVTTGFGQRASRSSGGFAGPAVRVQQRAGL